MKNCSIIIPCYNCENTIMKCVNSLLEQNYDYEYEIILIDDESTDNTLNIIKNIDDKKIRVLHEKNSGPAYARLYGVKQARFEKLIFVDSDDFVDKNYIYYLLNEEEYIPFCLFNKSEKGKLFSQKDIKSGIYSKWEIIEYILNSSTMCTFWRMCFDKNDFLEIKMNNLKYCEDVLFIVEYLIRSQKKIKVIPERIYNYNISNSNSLSKKFYDEKNLYSFVQLPFEIKKIFDKYYLPFNADKYVNREICFSLVRVYRIVDYKSFKSIFLSKKYSTLKKLQFDCEGSLPFKLYLFAFRTSHLFLIDFIEKIFRANKNKRKKINITKKLEIILNEKNSNNDNKR